MSFKVQMINNIMAFCNNSMNEIDRNECIGNSLPKINENFETLDNLICDLSAAFGEFTALSGETNIANVGSGAQLIKPKTLGTFPVRTLTAGTGVNITTNTDTVNIQANAANVGTGTGEVFKQTTGAPLSFRKLKAGTNITSIQTSGDDVIINASLSGVAGLGDAINTKTLGTNEGSIIPSPSTSGNNLRLKVIKGGSGVVITNNPNDIQIDATGLGGGEANTASNLGTTSDGAGLFTTKSGVNLPFKRIKAGPNVTITEQTNSITISATGGGGGSITGAQNLGTGIGVFKDVSSTNLRFKSIASTGTNITVSEASDTLTISSPNAVVNSQNIAGATGEGSIVPSTTKSGSNLQFKKLKQGSGIQITDGPNDITITAVPLLQSLTTNGHIKLPGGLIIQWGQTSATFSGNGSSTVNYPISFANAVFIVNIGTITSANDTTNQAQQGAHFYSTTTSQFTWYVDRFNDSGDDPIGIAWIAIGH